MPGIQAKATFVDLGALGCTPAACLSSLESANTASAGKCLGASMAQCAHICARRACCTFLALTDSAVVASTPCKTASVTLSADAQARPRTAAMGTGATSLRQASVASSAVVEAARASFSGTTSIPRPQPQPFFLLQFFDRFPQPSACFFSKTNLSTPLVQYIQNTCEYE